MKAAYWLLAISACASLIGCRRGPERIGDAPRTETAAPLPGWKEVATSGVAIQFPDDWKALDLAREDVEKAVEQAFGNDPQFAALRAQVSEGAKQGLIKLMAFKTSSITSGFATNCNIIIQEVPRGVTIEHVAQDTVRQISSVVVPGTTPRVDYLSLAVGRTARTTSEIRMPNMPAVPLTSIGYTILKGSQIVVVTFTTPTSEAAGIKATADKSMERFRFTD